MNSSGPRVSSPRNPRIQRVRKLHRRTFRERERAFLLEGPVPVMEALGSGHPLQEIFIEAGAAAGAEVHTRAERVGVPVFEVPRAVMEAASDTATPQGVLAVADMPTAGLESLPEAPSLVLTLAGISDPGNAGTLLRSGLAAGAQAVIFLGGSVDPFGPKTVRASAGAVLRTRVIRDVTWAACRTALAERELRTVGTAAHGGAPLDQADLTGRIALVVGNEASGLRSEVLAGLDEVVSIPMPGPVESLNAAVAGSVVLFEIVRRRRASTARRPVSSDDG